MPRRGEVGAPLPPDAAVRDAIQRLTAARLGRGFLPLAALLVLAGARWLWGGGPGEAAVLALGAPLSAVAMLAYGVRSVQRAFGRATRPWMRLAAAGSVIPPLFGLWALAWPGLRGLTTGPGAAARLSAAAVCLAALWLLRRWMGVMEARRLADTMADLARPGPRGPAPPAPEGRP